jgi:hypothetical protein
MTTAAGQVIDLIFGRWRSQVLAAGTELGIFDRLDRTVPRTARELAADMGLDAAPSKTIPAVAGGVGNVLANAV